ncbi:MAG TPA: glycosyltransferase [Acidiphilium sp.]|nr:glycosyltransferase [Acidiphilium sp.]
MRLVIDVQGAQTKGSATRGIGRYTLALAQEIARLRGDHEIIIVASDAFPESLAPLRRRFAGLLPPGGFRVWKCPRNLSPADQAGLSRRRAAELVREAFLASLRPDAVLICSLFEGSNDDSVASIGMLHDIPTAVVLYDLIPLIHREIYLSPSPVWEAWYEAQLAHLRRADLVLGISGSTCLEAETMLGLPASRIAAIGAAADDAFHRQDLPAAALQAVRARHGLGDCFVMYTGGIDHRKNIERMIAAFARLPAHLRDAHQLAIVCSADAAARERLQTFARAEGLGPHDLVLTGFIPEDELIALYHACTLFVFPSWHEGFGLPALEAMACGAPVIASNTSSLPEVVGCDEALFDPMDTGAIAAKLAQALGDEPFRRRLTAHGLRQAATFSWQTTARRALDALTALKRQPPQPAPAAPRPRLAYVSPLPPERSGISDYSVELLPELGRFYEIELIVRQDEVLPAWLGTLFPIRTPDELRDNPARYDRVLYHVGNSAFHEHMFDLLAEVPGVVVLHDVFLSGVMRWMEDSRHSPGHFARALYRSHGYAAAAAGLGSRDAGAIINTYACNLDPLDKAVGVIVHSAGAARLAADIHGAAMVRDWSVIPLLRTPTLPRPRSAARARLGLPGTALLTCSFGIVAETKLNHALLDAWLDSDLAENPDAMLVFVGESSSDAYTAALLERISRSPEAARIAITGWTDAATYRDYLAAADIAVQLRTASRGETSAAVLDCLNNGLATIVNANGAMAELDENIVVKLPDAFDQASLVAAIERLAADPAARQALGRDAREHVRRRHAPRACAEAYHQAIETAWRRALMSVEGAIARIGQLDPPLSATELREAAACLAQNRDRPGLRQLLVEIPAGSGGDAAPHDRLAALLRAPPAGYRVEPIRFDTTSCRYARCWTMDLLGLPRSGFTDDHVEAHDGDILLLQPAGAAAAETMRSAFIRSWVALGIRLGRIDDDIRPDHPK